MKNLAKITCLIFLMIINNVHGMKECLSEEAWHKLTAEEKLKQKKLIVENVYALRNIKAMEKLLRNFYRALYEQNKEKLVVALNQVERGYKININEPIYYMNSNNESVKELPIICFSMINPNVEIMKVLLDYGAEINFNEVSLIYLILKDLNDDEFLWESNSFYKQKVNMRNRYLAVLKLLLEHSKFYTRKDEESESCANLWVGIMYRACSIKSHLGKQSASILKEISSKFFIKP